MATPEKKQHSYEGETFEKDHSKEIILDSRSPGVRKIEAITSSFTTTSLTILFVGIFLASYAYGLDSSTRYVYQVSNGFLILWVWCYSFSKSLFSLNRLPPLIHSKSIRCSLPLML
jgi:hypothetical protein